MMHGVLFTC